MRDRVSVIGAGTAGLIAARNLAEKGIDTVVYDQKERLGVPARASGIVSISGLDSLGIGYGKAITNTLHGANIHAGGSVMRVRAKGAKAHVVDRTMLNEICEDEGISAGAKVVKGRKIEGRDLDRMHSESIIIGADGPVSTVARHFSMGSISRYALTYKAEYNVNARDSGVVDLYFNNSLTPRFFAWLCPNAKDVLEVGIGIDSKYGNSKAAFDGFVKQKEIAEAIGGSKMLNGHASMIPMQTMRQIVSAGKEVLLVGDAAGQVKPTTGGGIVFGGNAAIIAARVIRDHIEKGRSLSDYERIFRKRYGFDIRLHSVISSVYSGSTTGLGYLLRMSNALGLDAFFGRYGDMDRPSLMLKRFFLRSLAK